MATDINYRKQVNQQLAAAVFQLSLLENSALSLSKLQQASCHQACLHHLYYLVSFYVNEVLDNYKREVINFEARSLQQLFESKALYDYSMIELSELQQWYDKPSSLLNYLVQLDQKLNRADAQKTPTKTNQENLIVAVIVVNELDLLNDKKELLLLKKELSTLIDRQRECLQEH